MPKRHKRIDLLFQIDGVRHIVELKAVPLTREHVGQIAEYFGLMRTRFKDGEFKLVLVAPSIPVYRSALLETIGIRCVEVPHIPETVEDVQEVKAQVAKLQREESKEAEIRAWAPRKEGVAFDDLVTCRREFVTNVGNAVVMIRNGKCRNFGSIGSNAFTATGH